MRAIGRVIASLIGFILAVIAAAVFMLATRVGLQPSDPDASDAFWLQFLLGTGLAASLLGAAALVPSLVLILVAEVFRIRAALYYILTGGAMAGLAVLGLVPSLRMATDDPARATVLIATGFVGGFVYWLTAGRMAGLTAPPSGGPARAQEPSAPGTEKGA